MFLVNDSLESRQKLIRSFVIQGQSTIAVLLAAADFERTVRRAIMALGTSTTKHIRLTVLGRENIRGFNGYLKAWNAEVARHVGVGLKEVIGDWDQLAAAFALRNQLIHGEKGSAGLEYAARKAEVILNGASAIHVFAAKHDADLAAPLKRRLKPRGPA